MASSVWTVEYDGVTKTLEEWGIVAPRLSFRGLEGDSLVFDVVEVFDGADVFGFEEEVILYKDGVQWFVGEVIQTPRILAPGAESHGYVVAGPLAWLGEVMYGQSWFQAGGALKTTHVLLNRGLRTDQQVADALQAGILAGMPAQIGTVDTLTAVPLAEVRDMTCLEVIQSQLRWSPDAVLWVDYSTTPPTVHCRRWSNLAQVSAVVGGDKLAGANIIPRQDLVLPGVLLNFETVADVDGVAELALSQQKYPPSITGFERRCLVATFDLQGPRITHSTAAVETALIEANNATEATRLNWWKAKLPWLRSGSISNLAITAADVKFWSSRWGAGPGDWTVDQVAKRIDGAVTTYWKALNDLVGYAGDPANDAVNWVSTGAGAFVDTYYVQGEIGDWSAYTRKRELVDGVWAKWLEDQGYSAERIVVTAPASFATDDPASQCSWVGSELLKVELVATDAPTGEFTSVESFEAGESVPAGLAEFLYNTHAILHYQGSINLTEEECTGSVRPGKRLNLSGGTGRFATMRAAVQEAMEDLVTGQTAVMFGPPRWLGPGDIVEWLRAWRTRRVWTNPGTQDDASYAAEAGTQTGKQAPSPNSSAGQGWASKQVFAAGDVTVTVDPANDKVEIIDAGVGGASIKLDLALCAGKEVKPRVITVCEDGVEKSMVVVASETYT